MYGGVIKMSSENSKKSYKKDVGFKKNEFIKIRVTSEEKEQILNQSKLRKMKMSEMIRQFIFKGLKKQENNFVSRKDIQNFVEVVGEYNQKVNELITEHNRIGNNINQITRSIYQGKVKDSIDIHSVLVHHMHVLNDTDKELLKGANELWRQLE